MKKRITALILVCLMLVGVLAGCGLGSGAGDDTTFSWWIYSGANSNFYTEYQENPAVQYTLSKTYGSEDKKLAFEFWTPAPGKEADNYSTMLVSGDLPDIIDEVICDPPPVMVANGYALDITEYVERNMPNYVALVHSNETYLKNCVIMVDGEEHYYDLKTIMDAPESVFQGFQYRRDWIVKYGKNPVTGAAFTGGYTAENDPDAWTDDVVFPSGGPDPIYISDWEWMFEIFETAMADLGITDSYCMSLYYPGFTWSGGLLSCFGGGVNMWYQDENDKVQFGGDQKYFRAYLECMHSWYEKGWLDQDFYQRTADAFYQIDETSVRQGKVGMFNGEQSKLGGRMDMNDGGYTEGIFVAAAPYPINDIYGDEDCQGKAPDCVMGGSVVGGGVLITPKANVADLFNHQTKKNIGELPKYYVHDCHPAIIDRATFQKVQEEIARRAGKRKTSSRAKTELGKYSGKYALSEILICGECGSPYRRQTYMPKGEKIYVWRCLNRMENGKRICKNSPTFKEEVLHNAIVAAMNEMFSQQAARDVLRESVATVLASTQPKMSLPAVKSKLAALEARYKELLDMVMADSAKYEDFEDEFRTTNEEMASLRSLQTKLELEQPSTSEMDRRMEQISSAIDQMDAAITDYDDIRTRQLISTIKVLDKETLLIRFKDGTEITQHIEK